MNRGEISPPLLQADHRRICRRNLQLNLRVLNGVNPRKLSFVFSLYPADQKLEPATESVRAAKGRQPLFAATCLPAATNRETCRQQWTESLRESIDSDSGLRRV